MRIFTLIVVLLFNCIAQAGNRKPVLTFITGLWDVGRGQFRSGYKRTHQYYLRFYKQLLQTDNNLIAFGDSSLKQFTAENRNKPNTLFIQKELSQIQKYWYNPKVEKAKNYLKSHPDQFDWNHFEELPPFGLKMYDSVVMSKLMLMQEALQKDIFKTDYFVWIDGGITHAYDKKDKEALLQHAFQKIIQYYQIDWFLQSSPKFGWRTLDLGFKKESIRYRTQDPLEIPQANCWANWMGGKVEAATTVLAVYENLLRVTLQNNEVYIEQSIFTLMLQRYPLLLTKLDIGKAEPYIRFSANRLDYSGQIQVQRQYNLVINQSMPLITEAHPIQALVFVEKSLYDSIIGPTVFTVWQKTLVYRLVIVLVTIVAYLLVKLHYLNNHSNRFQYQIIENTFIQDQ